MTLHAVVGGLPLIGNLLEFLFHSDWLRMPPNAFWHFATRHPEAKLLRLSLGRLVPREEMVLVQDPGLARTVLSDSEAFQKGQGYRALHAVTPGHLPGLDGEAAAKRRRIAIRVLHGAQPLVERHADELAAAIAASTLEHPLELGSAVRAYALHVLFETVLGEPAAPDPSLVSALRLIMAEWQHRVVELSPVQHWRYWPRQRRLQEAKEQLTAYLRAKLHKARQTQGHSLLHALILEADGASDEELVELAFTLLATGHENASSFMVWALVCLAEHEALQAEVAREWTADGETPVTDRVLKETLRLYPPIPLLSRRATSREGLRALGIEGGDPELVVSPFVLHRLERIWGPNSGAFDPDRWRAPDAAMEAAYMPFGCGGRACIGQQWAHRLMRALLRALFKHRRTLVRLKSNSNSVGVRPCLDISLKPSGSVLVFGQ
jgi:cytochrome P450